MAAAHFDAVREGAPVEDLDDDVSARERSRAVLEPRGGGDGSSTTKEKRVTDSALVVPLGLLAAAVARGNRGAASGAAAAGSGGGGRGGDLFPLAALLQLADEEAQAGAYEAKLEAAEAADPARSSTSGADAAGGGGGAAAAAAAAASAEGGEEDGGLLGGEYETAVTRWALAVAREDDYCNSVLSSRVSHEVPRKALARAGIMVPLPDSARRGNSRPHVHVRRRDGALLVMVEAGCAVVQPEDYREFSRVHGARLLEEDVGDEAVAAFMKMTEGDDDSDDDSQRVTFNPMALDCKSADLYSDALDPPLPSPAEHYAVVESGRNLRDACFADGPGNDDDAVILLRGGLDFLDGGRLPDPGERASSFGLKRRGGDAATSGIAFNYPQYLSQVELPDEDSTKRNLLAVSGGANHHCVVVDVAGTVPPADAGVPAREFQRTDLRANFPVAPHPPHNTSTSHWIWQHCISAPGPHQKAILHVQSKPSLVVDVKTRQVVASAPNIGSTSRVTCFDEGSGCMIWAQDEWLTVLSPDLQLQSRIHFPDNKFTSMAIDVEGGRRRLILRAMGNLSALLVFDAPTRTKAARA